MSIILAMMLSTITARGVINPVVVAAPAGGNTSLYFTIRNSSHLESRLLRVTCDCAERIGILAARGGSLELEGEAIALPPERLVELRPGGDRGMLLLHLRRPLVAGQTVEMAFHFSDGRPETRTVRIIADPQAGWAEGLAMMTQRLGPMAGLAGWCWRGTFPDGRRTETRCFSPAYGMFMQDRHVVREGVGDHSTWTLYRYDVMGRSIQFRYDGPDGIRGNGRLVPADAGPTFEYYPEQPGREIGARTVWTRDSTDAWIVRGEVRRDGQWRERWRLRLVRAGPSPPF